MTPVSDDEDGYAGEATLVLDGAELSVTVTLRGNFEPVDGRYHWYGRIQAHDEVTEKAGSRKPTASLRTPFGVAEGVLSDPDPWGRYRISGTSRPPFEVPVTLEDLPAGC
ncbi:DUF4873 domain-containing protein [Actinophytocola algeriensis]|uniref:DUF4873 domain-containing protein n=1 Tax=Actinophytocola algeriensis TaxID=1768010 RepID=UPI00161F9C54|nr:DUF4873 domain-containing protein [Actinophytocola algeriensis]